MIVKNNIHNSRKEVGISRRSFIKTAGLVGASGMAVSAVPFQTFARNDLVAQSLSKSKAIGYHGMIHDSQSNTYLAGNGARIYSPAFRRFIQKDSDGYSPFGAGGANGYAFAFGSPFSFRDPSGHFPILSLIIGSIVGALVGMASNAISQGIRMAYSGDSFDWKEFGVSAALGAVTGFSGAAAHGASKVSQVGLAVVESIASGGIMFAADHEDETAASIITGMVVGLASFGVGNTVGALGAKISKASPRLLRLQTEGLSGRGAVGRGARLTGGNARRRKYKTARELVEEKMGLRPKPSFNQAPPLPPISEGPSLFEQVMDVQLIRDSLVGHLSATGHTNLMQTNTKVNGQFTPYRRGVMQRYWADGNNKATELFDLLKNLDNKILSGTVRPAEHADLVGQRINAKRQYESILARLDAVVRGYSMLFGDGQVYRVEHPPYVRPR